MVVMQAATNVVKTTMKTSHIGRTPDHIEEFITVQLKGPYVFLFNQNFVKQSVGAAPERSINLRKAMQVTNRIVSDDPS
jgi:hypothetical protein